MQVDQRNEAVLAPIYGVMVPFHVLTIKGATYSTGDTEHAVIRLNFNFGPSWEPGARHPGAIMLKELSYRCSDTRHAAKARPLIGVIGSPVLGHAPRRQGARPNQGVIGSPLLQCAPRCLSARPLAAFE